MNSPRILYVTFDVVPSPKGAAIHIQHFAKALAGFGALQLISVAPGDDFISGELCPGVQHLQIPAVGGNLITRVMNFRRLLHSWLNGKHFNVIHFRSPFEGLWIARDKRTLCDRIVFEVNGLPSIELKYRYSNAADDSILYEKLTSQELLCLQAADSIVTTCEVTKNFLQQRGADGDKVRVIPNGVDIDLFSFCRDPERVSSENFKAFYFGTLSPWQGLETVLRAVAVLPEHVPASMTLVGPASQSRLRDLSNLVDDLGISERIKILPPCSQAELVRHIQASHVVLAPLSPNDRNLEQGCCPLKVIETMATGIPLIVSDMPVVREIADDSTVTLAKPGSVGSWSEALTSVWCDYESALVKAASARATVEAKFTWQLAAERLTSVYQGLLKTDAVISRK